MPDNRSRHSLDAGNLEYARQSCNDAWGLYLGLVNGTNALEDIPRACVFFKEAIAAYQIHDMSFEEARAQHGIAVAYALMGRQEDCRRSARRCVELLDPWLVSSARPDEEKTDWTIKALRVLADGAPTALERLGACRRGLRLLRSLSAAEKRTRLRALFHRAAGSAEARRRPKTFRALSRGAAHLRKAISVLELLSVDRMLLGAKAKTWRELARACRALAGLRVESDPALTARALAEAERAARLAIESDREAGQASRWNHYHLAKILQDKGDPAGASEQRLLAVRCLEEGREPFDADDHRIVHPDDDKAIHDLGVR
jgi:tetratricopeptide (TPR) repeat protein